MKAKRAIIIMAKAPIPGEVKTRLQPLFSPEESSELSKCFFQDTVNKAKYIEERLIIAYSPREKKELLASLLPSGLLFHPQEGDDLGQRIANAFEFAFADGLDAAVMIGCDSPTFPASFLGNAFEGLEKNDACLGKSEDGGFYLIGLSKFEKRLFENIEWSCPETYDMTANNLNRNNFSIFSLPEWYDVDTPEDIKRLREDPLLERAAPECYRWLSANAS